MVAVAESPDERRALCLCGARSGRTAHAPAHVQRIAVGVHALVLPKAERRTRTAASDRPAGRSDVSHLAVDVRHVAARLYAHLDTRERVARRRGIRRQLRVDEDIAKGRSRIASLHQHATAARGANLAFVEVCDARTSNVVDVPRDVTVARVNAPAPEQGVLQAQDICVADRALIAILESQRFGLRPALWRQIVNRKVLDHEFMNEP